MRAASETFGRVIAGSHRMISRVDVMFDREVIQESLPVVAGSITFDRGAARLARIQNLTVVDPERVPVAAEDILSPFGYELLVWRGITYPAFGPAQVTVGGQPVVVDDVPVLHGVQGAGSASEMVPLGVFPIQRSCVDGVTLVSTITAMDRSQLVSDARFEDTYQVAAGTNYAEAIEALVLDGVPDLEVLFPTITFTTPALTFAAQDDRWEAAQKMARSCGHEILFDGLGRLTMRAEPTFSADPVARIAEAENMVGAGVALDRGPAYNRVIATSNNASNGEVFRGVATDTDPSSPTRYDGPFGRKPRFYASEFIGSNAQADSAAAAILASNLGVAKSIDFSAVPDPRLECSDVVLIKREALGLDELHIIETLTIGLAAGDGMTGTSRANQELIAA